MLEKTPTVLVQTFLDKFGAALEEGRVDDAVFMFADDCYWRDLVAFTWNIKTVEGHDEVRDMLQSQLQLVKPTKWLVAAGEAATEADGVTESWITFETDVARGYGLIRLKGGKIWTLLTVMSELKGHEEKSGFTRPLGAKHGQDLGAKTWKEEREEEARTLGYEKQPYVLVIGGGQGGIALGARLRQLGVPTIIVERNENAGTLGANATSHSACMIRSGMIICHILIFQKLAGFCAEGQDRRLAGILHQSDGTELLDTLHCQVCAMGRSEKEWSVVIDRDGETVILRPKQLVFATGMSGKPNIPGMKGQDRFRGSNSIPPGIRAPMVIRVKRLLSSALTIRLMISAPHFAKLA